MKFEYTEGSEDKLLIEDILKHINKYATSFAKKHHVNLKITGFMYEVTPEYKNTKAYVEKLMNDPPF